MLTWIRNAETAVSLLNYGLGHSLTKTHKHDGTRFTEHTHCVVSALLEFYKVTVYVAVQGTSLQGIGRRICVRYLTSTLKASLYLVDEWSVSWAYLSNLWHSVCKLCTHRQVRLFIIKSSFCCIFPDYCFNDCVVIFYFWYCSASVCNFKA